MKKGRRPTPRQRREREAIRSEVGTPALKQSAIKSARDKASEAQEAARSRSAAFISEMDESDAADALSGEECLHCVLLHEIANSHETDMLKVSRIIGAVMADLIECVPVEFQQQAVDAMNEVLAESLNRQRFKTVERH